MWDQAARWYDALVGERGSYYQKEIVLPGAFKMLGLPKGARVLDLACGQGVFSRYLFQKGMDVVGLDISSKLVELARERSDKKIRFEAGDAQGSDTLKGETFDAISCLLAIQNMERIEPVFKNAARWLRPGGKLVIVAMHPCFRIPRQTHWGWDADKKLEYRRVDRYSTELKIPILTPPLADSKNYTLTYHRPLQSYFDGLAKAGLKVEALEEWHSNKVSQPGKRSRAENRSREEFPLFLALRAAAGEK